MSFKIKSDRLFNLLYYQNYGISCEPVIPTELIYS